MATIDAKLRLTAQFSEAIRALEGLAAEFKAVQSQAQGLSGSGVADGLTAGLAAAEAQAEQTAAKVQQVGKAARASSAEAAAAAREAAAAQKAATQAERAEAKAASEEELRLKRAQYAEEKRLAKEAADAKRKVEQEAAAAKRKADKDTADAQRATDKATNAEAYKSRMLAPQITDIAVGLSTGQSPLMVALQQGGQLRDLYGGIGNAVKALGSVFTVTRVAIGGGAAALLSFAVAAYQGYKESDALNKSLAVTGNIAGVSGGQLTQMAKDLALSQQATIHSSREVLAALVASADFSSATMQSAGRAALSLAKLTGQSTVEIVKDFSDMSNGVTAWAQKHNQAYNFLTLDQFKYIRSLEAQGRTQEAMRVTLDTLNATMQQRSVPAIGALERAWNAVGRELSGVWDYLKSIGRDTTAEDKIASLQAALQRNNMANWRGGRSQQQVAADAAVIQAELDGLNRLRNADALRRSEKAIEEKNTQDQIIEASKEYQGALAQVDQAGAQRLLAQQLARLDASQGAVDVANAKGLLSAEQYSTKINAIEQARLAAQQTNISRRIEIAKKSVDASSTPIEKKAGEANVAQLEAELDAIRGRIAQAGAQGRAIAATAALTEDRERADAWAQLWQQAFNQVRQFANANAETDAARLVDPIQAAEAVAVARVASARQQLADIQRDMDSQIALLQGAAEKAGSPDKKAGLNAQAASLQAKRDELTLTGELNIAEQTRLAKQAELRSRMGQVTDALQNKEEALALAVQQGTLSATDGEEKKFAARAAALPQLEAILAAMRAIATTPDEVNALDAAQQKIAVLKVRTTELQQTLRDSVSGGFSQLFSDVATRAKSAGDAVRDFVGGIAKSMFDLISKRLGEQLMNSLLGPANGGAGGGLIGSAASFFMSMFHSGGVVGQGGGTMAVPLAAFAGAPRYHSGGIAGLKPNERPAVLLDGEEVLTENDPRHINNLRASSGGSGVSISGLNISVKVEGAQGGQGDMKGAGDRLASMVEGVVNQWAARESREGGILAKGRK